MYAILILLNDLQPARVAMLAMLAGWLAGWRWPGRGGEVGGDDAGVVVLCGAAQLGDLSISPVLSF